MPIPYKVRRRWYGPDWVALSRAMRAAHPFCGCRGECGRDHAHALCGATERLQVAHRNHDPSDRSPSNLAVWCSACHMLHDRYQHAERRAADRVYREQLEAEAAGQLRCVSDAGRVPPTIAPRPVPAPVESSAEQLELFP